MFEGAYTAIVTPFTKSGAVDYQRFQSIIEMQIKAGIDGIVPVGTTGESPTLNMREHVEVVAKAIEFVNKRVKVIAGTGANSTEEAIELTREAKAAGADATLQVTPYYNKPSQEGLYRHFTTVADIGLPVMLYNVPSRTGSEIAVETIAKLSKHPNIVSIKEAGGSVDRVSAIKNACKISILSGDDSMTLAMMSVGAKGVVSVASNIIPEQITKMTHAALEGRWEEAQSIHLRYFALFRDLFIESNPIPVKAAMSMLGWIEEVYRLPLCEISPQNRQKLMATLKKTGVLS